MATKCKIEAVQQRTSMEVHMSHSSGPIIQLLLICKKIEGFKERTMRFVKFRYEYTICKYS